MGCHGDHTERSTYQVECDLSRKSASEHVVEAIASFRDTDQTALTPIYTAIDPDALDALFEPPQPAHGPPIQLAFHYDDLAVTIDSTGSIRISPLE